MQTLLDIATLIAGYGLLVALVYAVYQFGEAKKTREATYLTSNVCGSPTELRISMETSFEKISEGKLNYDSFTKLPETLQEQILKPMYMFDGLGYLVSSGSVRLKTVTRYFGEDTVVIAWEKYRPLIEDARKTIGPFIFASFEDLAAGAAASKEHSLRRA
jgi:hypothetical protein